MTSSVHTFFICISDKDFYSNETVLVYAGVSLGSAFAGIMGALRQQWILGIILCHHWAEHKRHSRIQAEFEERKTRRVSTDHAVIIFCLALANALACLGTIGRSVGLLVITSQKTTRNETALEGNLGHISIFIEFMIRYSYTAGWYWTLAYVSNVLRHSHSLRSIASRPRTTWRVLILFNGLCWGLPIATIAPFLKISTKDGCPDNNSQVSELYVITYFPLLVVVLVMPFILIMVIRYTQEIMKKNTAIITRHQHEQLRSVCYIFVAMMLIFLFCWIPNLIDSIMQFSNYKNPKSNSLIWIVEAALNPLQSLISTCLYWKCSYNGRTSCCGGCFWCSSFLGMPKHSATQDELTRFMDHKKKYVYDQSTEKV